MAANTSGARAKARAKTNGTPDQNGHGPVDKTFDVDFPVADPTQLIRHLSRPFAVNDVRWKLQTVYGRGGKLYGTIVPFIDRGLVIARLNKVCGLGWSNNPEREGRDSLSYQITVNGVTREDVGVAGGNIEPQKSLRTDGLKRAATLFGVGAYLGTLPRFEVEAGPMLWTKELPKKNNGDKARYTGKLLAPGEKWLRIAYQTWLDGDGSEYGPPLAHGSAENAAGDPEDQAQGPDQDPKPQTGFAARADAVAASTAPADGLAATYRAAAQAVGEEAETTEKNLKGANGNERLLSIHMDRLTRTWKAEHKDEPVPWEVSA